ncbi:TonB-dependent receptor domain-containing protein [Aquimarina sp. 2304DJ70-9]|uniref:TonB-dependent receptor domain-containing protein n=1 Tax=Aquimarina penaris TaxID=3231044 RepID=UPI003462EA79
MQKILCILPVFFFFYSVQGISQNAIEGTVKDKNNIPILGVNVIIKDTNEGVSSDIDGNFKITTSKEYPVILQFSFLGYQTQEVEVTSASRVEIILQQDAQLMDEVVVSTSRKSERIIDAPASVSIISAKSLGTKPVENAAKALTSLVGVDVAEDNIGQYSVTLRGNRFPFGNTTLVMVDNRNIKIPGFDYSDFSRIPLLTEDFERIEVTRGPASALYGPGVSSGVIQYRSKSPIKYPGTTVTVGGGLQSTLQAGIKHAQKINDHFGFKISAKYLTAEAWEYDRNDPQDAAHLAINNTVIRNPVTGATILTLDPNDPVETAIQNFGIAGNIEYQNKGHLLNVNLGYSRGKAPFYLDRGDGYWDFPSIYSQVRYSKGGFFIQYDNNFINSKEGNSFGYKSGDVFISKNASHEIQTQYNFDLFKDKLNISVGGEYRIETTDSEGTIYGRFEDDDDFDIVGGYLYADYVILKDKLNLKATGRLDNFIAMDATEFSPQLAIVFKPLPGHSFRGAWSRTATPPPAVDFFGDVTVSSPSADQPFFINYLGGNALYNYDTAITNTFIPTGDAANPFVSFEGTDFPLQTAYAIALQELGASGQVPADLIAFLQTKLPDISGGSTPVLIDPLTQQPYAAGVNPLSAKTERVLPSITENYELGYKGFIGEKLAFEVSSYWGKSIRINQQITNPLSLFATISQDLVRAATGAISDPEYAFLGSQLGITADEARGLIAQAFTTVGDNLAAQPLGVVAHSLANKFPNAAEVHLTTQSVDLDDPIVWGGIEAGVSYSFNENLNAFVNYNFVNNDFNNTNVVNTGLTPRNRVKLGVEYIQEVGFSFGASMRYQDPYTASFQDGYRFSGVSPSFSVYDANVSYKFKKGLNIAVSGQNIFNNEYRAYPFTPKIGTMVLAKATYSFGGNK